MTVKELIQKLLDMPIDSEVYLYAKCDNWLEYEIDEVAKDDNDFVYLRSGAYLGTGLL